MYKHIKLARFSHGLLNDQCAILVVIDSMLYSGLLFITYLIFNIFIIILLTIRCMDVH